MLSGIQTVGGVGGLRQASREWLLRRNCALSPRQLGLFYVSLLLVSLSIGSGFALLGAWMVLPFCGLEMVALAVALLVYARHATDHERVVLEPGRLWVERVEGAVCTELSFDAGWVRIETEENWRSTVVLRERDRRVVVGRFVDPGRRRRFAQELSRALRGG